MTKDMTDYCQMNTDKQMKNLAGTVEMDAFFKYKKDESIPEGDVAISLMLGGLKGGMCGNDILQGRGNAIKLMVRFLKHAIVNFEARLAEVHGGDNIRNVIPNSCMAVVTVPADVADELRDEVAYYEELYRYEYRGIDEGIRFSASLTNLPEALVPEEVQDDVINSVEACFDGVFRLSPDKKDVVETSSNLALLNVDSEEAHAGFLIRSMDDDEKKYLASMLHSVFVLGGAKVEFSSAYSSQDERM